MNDVLTETSRGPRSGAAAVASEAAGASADADIRAVLRDAPAGAADLGELDGGAKAEAKAVREALLSGSSLEPSPTAARFLVLKSYSEDDVHKALKYKMWSSTAAGNRRLDAAYAEAQAAGVPLFLFFSVNASAQFCGVAQMTSPVNHSTSQAFWQQATKWSGCLTLRWHCVKDVPNAALRHIMLAPPPDGSQLPGKPVTNSRDTQEVPFEAGLAMLDVFKRHAAATSLLDDFAFYGHREAERDRMRRTGLITGGGRRARTGGGDWEGGEGEQAGSPKEE